MIGEAKEEFAVQECDVWRCLTQDGNSRDWDGWQGSSLPSLVSPAPTGYSGRPSSAPGAELKHNGEAELTNAR